MTDAPPASAAIRFPDGSDLVYALGFVTWRAVAGATSSPWAFSRLLRAVVEDERLRRVLVVDPLRSVAVVPKRALRREPRPALPPGGRVALYSPLRLRRRDPVAVRAVERSYGSWDRRVRRAAAAQQLERPAVITNDPLVAGFAPLEWAGRVTLYATDDLSAHPSLSRWRGVYERGYDRIRERGRAVCAVSEELAARIATPGPSLVVPNGIDPREWVGVGPPPPWFSALPRPRLLYVGTLDARIDAESVRRVAGRFAGGSVALVGPIRDAAHIAPLEALANVHVHDSLARDQLASVVSGCDVGLIPHVRNRLTEAMSPLKLYEYLAAGRPVAAVDLPPLRGVDPRVVLADDGDLAGAAEVAVRLGPAAEEERRRFLDANAWRRRHAQILDLALGGRGRAGPSDLFQPLPAVDSP